MSIFWGIIIIGVGIWIWLSNYGIADFRWSRDWPVILVAIGLAILLESMAWAKRRKR